MGKRTNSRRTRPKRRSDGTRRVFWFNLLLIFVLAALLILGQWDFLLAGVLLLLVINGLLGRQ